MKKTVDSTQARYQEVIGILKPDYFTFPLAEITPTSQPGDAPQEGGNERFSLEMDILSELGITAETLSMQTGLEAETVSSLMRKEIGYEFILANLKESQEGYSRFSKFTYLVSTIATTYALTQNFCDYSTVVNLFRLEKVYGLDAVAILVGIERKTLDAFMLDPTVLSDGAKYVLSFQLMQLERMLERM